MSSLVVKFQLVFISLQCFWQSRVILAILNLNLFSSLIILNFLQRPFFHLLLQLSLNLSFLLFISLISLKTPRFIQQSLKLNFSCENPTLIQPSHHTLPGLRLHHIQLLPKPAIQNLKQLRLPIDHIHLLLQHFILKLLQRIQHLLIQSLLILLQRVLHCNLEHIVTVLVKRFYHRA